MVSPWISPFVVQAHDDRMVRMTVMDIQVSLRNPTAMLEDSMTSVKMLCRPAYTMYIQIHLFASNAEWNLIYSGTSL